MKSTPLKGIIAGLLACFVWLHGMRASRAAETDSIDASDARTNLAVATTAETNLLQQTEAQEALRAFLKLQERLHEERLAEERFPHGIGTLAAEAGKITARLEAIEHAFQARGERDFQAMQSSNRTILIAAMLFAGVSLLTILFTSVLQWRAVNRLAEAASAAAGVPLLNGPAVVSDSTSRLIGPATNARWLGVARRLEQRIRELEEGVGTISAGAPNANGVPHDVKLSDRGDVAAVLLGKGQTLLNLGNADEALQCFDAVLAEEPTRGEAMLGRGMALERLKRLDEAMECYDGAGASDPSLTRAWLCKAAVLNQQERFAEALVCYERALHIQ